MRQARATKVALAIRDIQFRRFIPRGYKSFEQIKFRVLRGAKKPRWSSWKTI
jgi:hypothetical protein